MVETETFLDSPLPTLYDLLNDNWGQLQEATGRLPAGAFTRANAPERSAAVEKPDTSRFIPPPEQHITEGSFFIADDKAIMQVQDGEAVPILHGTKALRADGTGLIEQRLRALIHIRDYARRVLQSQNEGWPEEHRQQARFT